MGSAIGGLLSYKAYKKQKKDEKAAAERVAAEEARAKALTPAQAVTADTADVLQDAAKRRRGVQATMYASAGKGYTGGVLG